MIEIGEVRDNRDPSGSGRCKVRRYNRENDEQAVPDESLCWAHPMTPITSSSSGGIGIKPKALVVGARVLLMYMPEDHDKQSPIIMGTLPRAYGAKEKGIQQRDPNTGADGDTTDNPDLKV
jgi:hypothetical protein